MVSTMDLHFWDIFSLMKLSIQKWGNSAAVRLPAALLDQAKLELGDQLSVEVRPDGIMLTPARPSYALADLVAQCDFAAPMPEDLAAWNNLKPVGGEAW
ncbi:transcriptional regulator/antitoxin MazE [Caballeronia pedi]|uniref:Transcriptional regulator/antitoxin MazE n=2 Tax=Caballeronia pedi TaxID=1777141 RepID=A0A158B379_9BURK|nr:transcriptional regulator/antitoxin MazE [Caballeronia pedi]